MKIKELKKGEFFTLTQIYEPKENQVYVRGEYDRAERKYECYKWNDVNNTRFYKGEKEVFIDFIF